jgi:hypothetical protein
MAVDCAKPWADGAGRIRENFHKLDPKPPSTCRNAPGDSLTCAPARGYTARAVAAPSDRRSAWKGDMGRGVSEAWEVMATMISGILVWGGIGLLVDLRLGFRWLLLPVGMLLGTAVAIALVWLKHGRDDGAT